MAQKQRTRIVNLSVTPGTFASLFKRLRGKSTEYDFSQITELRQLLSNEKAKILHTIQTHNPDSIYKLARVLGREFKSVREDIKVLEKYGFIELKAESKGNRKRLKPLLAIDALQININFK